MASETTTKNGSANPTDAVKEQPRQAAQKAEKNTTKELLEEGGEDEDDEEDEDFVSQFCTCAYVMKTAC